MREVIAHKANGLNDALKIRTLDEPGAGGANHRYEITTTERAPAIGGGMSPESLHKAMAMAHAVHEIRFQNGPLAEKGVNGISNEALLAVVIDRLQCFQRGPYSCRENAIALTKLEEAMHWLQHRTRERIARGVEGTSAK